MPDLGDAAAQINSQIKTWQAEKRYLGHQLVSSQIRSFDLETDSKAVVTVRETWEDNMYIYQGDYPEYIEQSFAERGPYELDVTYTLELKEEETGSIWQITWIVYANQPPEW